MLTDSNENQTITRHCDPDAIGGSNLLIKEWMLLIIMLIGGFSTYAQVNMSVQLIPPYDVALNDIKEQITLTINAPAGVSGELRINFTRTTDEGVIVRTLPNLGKDISIRGGAETFSGSDFDGMFSSRNLEFIGVDANEALNDEGLPPGEYSLCFYLIGGRLGGTLGSGCANFTVPEPTITINTQITPPYNQPFGDLNEQVSVMLTSSRGINDGLLRMTLTGNNGINITTNGRGMPVQLDKNAPLTLMGSDLDALFATTNLNFNGISPGEANENGLPPGDYQICFRLWYNGENSQTGRPPDGCNNFTIDPPVISINTTITPPYDRPFNELGEQVRVTVNAPIDIDDGFFTIQLHGNNGINITTKRTAKDYLQISKNVPFVAAGADLDFHFTAANLDFQGISANEVNENGLPPGDYELCFRLWYDDNDPATDASDGCANFSIDRGVVTLTTTVVPPYDVPFNDFGEQSTVTINSTQLIDDGFLRLRITGDNGIQISSKAGAKDFLVIDKNTPTSLTGSDLSFLFQAGNLNFQGITAAEANENGLPPGDYELCFRLWYDDNDPATGFVCSNFRIDRGMVTLTTRIVPPYDVPLQDLADQVTVSLNATKNINDAFLRLLITGDNGVQISSKPGQKELINVAGNDPLTLTGSDLDFHFNSANLNFQGITATEANENGLPPGNYELCFRLWYADNDPATDAASGCANFTINRGAITLVPVLTPPYDGPFNGFSEQTNLTITSTQAVKNAFLRLRMIGNNGIQISSKNANKDLFDIEKNEPLALGGTDLDFLYEAANLNFTGITAAKANEDGLPPGDYELCFRLWYGDSDPATEFQCMNFTISQGVVTLTTILTPPFDQPFQDLDEQTTVMINSSQNIDDGFLTLSLEGDNGIKVSSKSEAKDFLQIEQNVPLSLTGGDLSFLFNSTNLNFQGISANEANENGLPPGNYELCFRLWYDDNEPATDESTGCANFNISEGVVTLNTIFTPPYIVPLSEMVEQVTVNINATQNINDGFLRLQITGDNGVEIATRPGAKSLVDIGKNEPVSLSGTDLDFYFNAANLSFTGITAAEANQNGLPPGNYELCFRLWYNDEDPATGEAPVGCAAPFTIGEGLITINTVVTPPYNAPLDALLEQTSVTITATNAVDDAFLTFDLRGDNGIHISSSAEAVNELLQIFPNEPMVITPSDLIGLNGTGVTFEGITYADAVEHGLPSGNYELCFRLWHDVNEPATDEGTGCAMFNIAQGVVTINTVLTPPYETPFSGLADQLTVTLLSTQRIENAHLTLLLEEADGNFSVRSDVADVNDRYVNLETNELLTLSGTDLAYLFESSRLFFQGIDPGDINENGLPAGDYTLCFRLWYDDGEPATDELAGCVNFSVAPALVSLNTVVIPPYNQALSDLSEQANVTINSNSNLNDVFLRLRIEGDNGVQIATRVEAKELFDIEENVPLTLSGIDLDFLFNTTNLTLQGVTAAQLNDFGLPPGLYDLCFQLWYDDNDPVTDAMQGCYQFTVEQANLTLAVQVIPPYTPLIEDMASMTNLTLMASADMQLILNMRISGDNDIVIANSESFVPSEVIALEANTPLMLSDLDLGEYFAANALVFSGISQGEALDNGLPEGNYQICFTALTPEGMPLDVQEACSNMFPINYVEPPQVMTPECGSVISANETQHLIFNWLPAIGAPADAEYTLKIVELLNPNQNPNDAILSSTTPSFLEETVTGTSFFYGPAQPILEPGRTYAFQVYVGEEINRGNYVNRGGSPVCYFTIEEEEELVDLDEEAVPTKENVTVTGITQNPFPGYFFPISQVTGTLKYRFKSAATVGANLVSSNQINASSSQNFVMTSGGNGGNGNNGNGNVNPGFAQSQQSNAMVSNEGVQNYVLKPVYNQSNMGTIGTKPLANVKVSLLQTYVLFGQLNGESVTGKLLQDGDITQGQNNFESQVASGWNQVVATTTTDMDGNFSFNVVQFDSLGEAVDVDWSSTQGDIAASWVSMQGRIYKVYRLIVESPYYCSPDMNIMVQPWEEVDLGTLVSYVRSYNLRVFTKRLDNNFFDYGGGGSNSSLLTEIDTKIIRENHVSEVPVDEGQHEYGTTYLQAGDKLINEGRTNIQGYVDFKNLVRHNANNTLDQYHIVCTSNDYDGNYAFQETEVPYPVFPYNEEWDWKKNEIAFTFHLPTSQDKGYGLFPLFNSQFEEETFVTNVEMKPKLPRIAGQVLSKQAEVSPQDTPDQLNVNNTANTSNSSVQNFNSIGNGGNNPVSAAATGFNLTTNSSAATFSSSGFYLGSIGMIALPDWSEKVNVAPLPNIPVKLLAVGVEDYSFNKLTTIKTDANGRYAFNGLPVELKLGVLNDENVNNDALWTNVIGPSRALFTHATGYKNKGKDLSVLYWGQQLIYDFELEPDGYVFGYVEDEWGHPVKAEVFVDSLVSTTTVMSAEYQEILGIPMPLKEIFVLKAPSGNNRKLQIVPDNLLYVPTTFEVDIEENQNDYDPQNLGGFQVETYKHRIRLQVVEKTPQGMIVTNPFPIKNALVRITNVLNDSPEENTKSAGNANASPGQTNINISSAQGNPGNLSNQNQGMVQVGNTVSEGFVNLVGDQYYGYTDEDGYVELVFENNAHYFDIEILPPADKDFVSKTITLYSESTGQTVDHGKVALDPAFRIAGKVTFGTDSVALENARVLIDQGGDNIETRTDAQGNYTLKGIPLAQNQWSVSAENVDHPLTLVADVKTTVQPFPKTVNFHLTVFDAFEVKELMGLPVTVSAIEEVDGNWFVTGAFINLPANPNFSPKEEETRLKFFNIPVTPKTVEGKNVAVPVDSSVPTESDRLALINYTTFIAEQTPAEGNLLKIEADDQGKGFLAGKVDIQSTSFQFEENYMSFNQPNAPSESEPSNAQSGNPQKNNQFSAAIQNGFSINENMVVTDAIGKAYIQLFSTNTSFRLYEQSNNSTRVTTLKAGEYLVKSFGVTNAFEEDYTFKVQDFNAVARKQDSYVYMDSLVLGTTLMTNNIPKMVPDQLAINMGELRITSQGFDKIFGTAPIQFNLEKWEVVCEDWELDQYTSGIRAKKGTVKTSLFHTAIKDIKITPNDLDIGAVDMNNITFGGVIPVKIETNTLAFGINPACTYDNEAHWMMKVTGTEGNPGASISNLPGMQTGDKINIESFTLYSNDEKSLLVGGQNQSLLFYDVVYVSPYNFNVMEGGVQMDAMMELKIPRLQKGPGGFRYIEEENQIESLFLGMNVDFEGQGKVEFLGDIGTDNDPAQVLTQGNFDARGFISDPEGIYLKGRLHKDKDSTYVIVEPLHQQLPIADDGSNKLIEITGDMNVVGNDWEYFVFSGDLYGMKGIQDSQKRKTFTVYGSINAEGEGMDVKNINADFAGIKMTYDIKHARLTGELEFEQNFSAVSISGKANLLADRDGWYFMANGAMEVPGFGNLKAGLGIGDYAQMAPDMKTTLLANAYDKTIPPSFQNGFSGFFFTGRKNFPQFSIPKTEFNFIIVSGALSGETGLDARLWMGFDDSGAEFGIGVMAYAYIDVALSGAITCTSVYGHVGAELGVKGMYNTGNSTFSLQGCGAIILAGKVEQCFGALGACCWECCVGTEGSTALKVDMLIDSNGTFDASLGFGSCSGNTPGMGGNW